MNLTEILKDHALWLGGGGGERANLRGANLRGANLEGANLWGTRGNGEEIKSLQIGTYDIVYTSKVLKIGCKQHTFEEWYNFSDEEIDDLDMKALSWWRIWKEPLFNIFKLGGEYEPTATD